MFEELKRKYENEILTDEQFIIITETPNIIVENNGNSGRMSNYLWVTAKLISEDNFFEEDEFDFYVKQ